MQSSLRTDRQVMASPSQRKVSESQSISVANSLGANSKTLMVACISPAGDSCDETLSTLRHANRAKNIKNKPVINEDPKDALIRKYQDEIMRLNALLEGKQVDWTVIYRTLSGMDLAGADIAPEPGTAQKDVNLLGQTELDMSDVVEQAEEDGDESAINLKKKMEMMSKTGTH
eukprot:Clim_evm58s142 gene=Clim_evmTU58s142